MNFSFLVYWFMAMSLPLCVGACTEKDGAGKKEYGNICLKMGGDMAYITRAASDIPDTNDFILDVKAPDGETVYSGKYGDSPEMLVVEAGSCEISVRSADPGAPVFNRPRFGDYQCVVVPPNGTVNAVLDCRQMNAGMKLNVAPDFLETYPGCVLFLKSAGGRLMYSYSEKRYAYFEPGDVSLVLVSEESGERALLTKRLKSAEMLSLNVYASRMNGMSPGITINLDTARVWKRENYVISSDSMKGSSADNSLTVRQAKESVGMKGVWVSGYIVGGDMTSSPTGLSCGGPFKSDTHMAIASRSSVTGKASCIAVQLPKGTVRDVLNLPGHPDMRGRWVSVRGDIVEDYFGVEGLKNVSDYYLSD